MNTPQPELVSSNTVPAEGDNPSLAFRIAAWVVVAAIGLLSVFGLIDAVIMWLPDNVVLNLVDSLDASDLDYRVHFHHLGIVAWVIAPALVVQLRRPVTRVAPMLQAWGATAAYLGVMAASGDAEVSDLLLVVATSLLVGLHPARDRILRRPRLERLSTVLVIAAIVPLLIRTVDSITEARNALPGVTAGGEQTDGLWATVAIVPMLLVITGLLGSSDYSSWQLPAWTTAAVAIDLGLHSMVFSDDRASLPLPWAGAIAVWGMLYAITIMLRHRQRRAER